MADIEETIDVGDPERRRRDIAYYKSLKAANDEYMQAVGDKLIGHDPFLFAEWVSITYGFQPHTDHMGHYTTSHTVTDEAKYAFYLLKYSK